MSPPTGTPPPSGTLPSRDPPLGGSSVRLVNTNLSSSTGTPPPSGNLPLGGISSRLVNTKSSSPARGFRSSGNSPLGGDSFRLVDANQSPSTATIPHSGGTRQPQLPQLIMNDMFLPDVPFVLRVHTDDHEMQTGDDEDEETTSDPPPSSVDPSQPLTGGPAMSAALDEIASERKNRPTSFKHLKKPPKLLCAIQINDNEIMGNPFSKPKDWSLKLALDPGTLGVPSVSLDFQFCRDEPSHDSIVYQNSFNVAWEPGVKIGGSWMMEDITMMPATSQSDELVLRLAYPPAIKELLEKSGKRPEFLTQNLVFAMFQSNVHRVSELKWEWLNALEDDARRAPLANLDTMLNGKEPSYTVKMWFVNRKLDLVTFYETCLGPLIDAVTDHTPPHQYLDDDDQPFINYDLPSSNGQEVENRSVPPKHLSQPKTVRLDSIKTLHTSASIREEEKASIAYAQGGPRSPRGPPRKAQRSPADFEMLRLKDRQTLHRLKRS